MLFPVRRGNEKPRWIIKTARTIGEYR
jgi:hypothetical protein